ncbi:MAG TPA: efflux RND transporter permease subunit [Candidatus Omnitrophota bacterium]|nr:efflux RND transporter permease subunit [Candidatus Omnitrophota bacterium]HPS36675.1 efflux RND transporter permease subunit [Candidatus Omnitrophota bacterium]
MNLSEISIKNPVFAWMLMLGLIFFGLISFGGLGVGQMPDVDFPVLNVSVTWEGAAPEVIETDVVDILEDSVMGVEGLREVSSVSREGAANVTLEFDLDRDIDVALQEVQSKIAEAQRRLPRDMDPAVIQKFNPEDQPILWIGVTSNKPVKELMDYVDRNLKDRFKTVPGVGEIFLGGFLERNLRVWLDTKKLLQYQLTVEDVVNAIQTEHVEIPAGRLETAERESSVRAMGEARTVKEFEKIVISTRQGQPNYRQILLKEVATIEDGLADVRKMARVMGQDSVGIGIRKQRGANTVEVAKAVKKRLTELKKTLPPGYDMDINFDSSKFIEDSVHELVFTLILSALLTSLVCWIFLGSWSSNLNILLAIPTSILGAFIVIKFAGFTLNTFTLLGLSLAIGIVVDDAIMVLENIVRHREKGEAKVEAALKGSKEIMSAAIAATLSIAAIFIPVIYMQGIVGKYFLQFGITITVAVFLSLLEALTLAPMRCSQFLEVGERSTRFGKKFERGMIRLSEIYHQWLTIALDHKKIVLAGAAIFFILSLFTLPFLRKEMSPAQDQSMFLVQLETPIGSSIAYTSERFKEVEALAMKHPDVKRYFCVIGTRMGGFEGEMNAGLLFMTLKDPLERKVDPKLGHRPNQEELMDYFRREINKIPKLRAVIQDLSMRGFAAYGGFPVQFTVRGPNWDKLIAYATEIQEKMKSNPMFQDVDTDYRTGVTEVRIYPDRDKAYEHGVSVHSIAETINAMIGGEKIAKYTQDGRRYDVRVKALPDQRMTPEDISKLWVWNNRGEMVRLSEVIIMKEQPSLLNITRRARERSVSIYANVPKGKSQANAIKAAAEIGKKVLKDSEYHVVFSGTSQTMKESFGSLGFAMLLGLIVAYMVLASQYNHIVHPITIFLALPFSISGAFLALLIANQSLNIFSFIGLILLMGIVKKNSILLVDFTNQMRERGLTPLEALKAACPIRLRPIIMTSVSTIAAAIPPALALGPGAETRIPMAVCVIGGVLVSTLLTLFVVPTAYLVFVKLEDTESMKNRFENWVGIPLRSCLSTGSRLVAKLRSKL